jgi:hypothetical protein
MISSVANSAPTVRLKHLRKAIENSEVLRDEIFNPLESTVQVAGAGLISPAAMREAAVSLQSPVSAGAPVATGWQGTLTGLGVATGMLGGIVGVTQMVIGAKEQKPSMLLSGAAEITVSAASLGSLIPGAGVLAPIGAALMGLRGAYDSTAPSRAKQMGGVQDFAASAAVLSNSLGAPLIAMGLGATTSAVGVLAGLHDIRKAHESHDAARTAHGLSTMATALGVGLIASGVGLLPGMALVLGGLAEPMLRHFKKLQPIVDRVNAPLEKLLYPVARVTDKALDKVGEVVIPLLKPLKSVAHELDHSALMAPVHQAIEHSEAGLASWTNKQFDGAGKMPVMMSVDRMLGRFVGGD